MRRCLMWDITSLSQVVSRSPYIQSKLKFFILLTLLLPSREDHEHGERKSPVSISLPALWHPGAVHAGPVQCTWPGQSWHLWKSNWNGVYVWMSIKKRDWSKSHSIFLTCVSFNSGQVSESDMWSAQLALRPWREEETGGRCSAAGRRGSSFHLHPSALSQQLLRRAGLDHWFCSKKGWTRFGVKVEGKGVIVFQMWPLRGSLGNVGFNVVVVSVCVRRKSWKERRGMNDWKWSETTFNWSMRWRER